VCGIKREYVLIPYLEIIRFSQLLNAFLRAMILN